MIFRMLASRPVGSFFIQMVDMLPMPAVSWLNPQSGGFARATTHAHTPDTQYTINTSTLTLIHATKCKRKNYFKKTQKSHSSSTKPKRVYTCTHKDTHEYTQTHTQHTQDIYASDTSTSTLTRIQTTNVNASTQSS